MEVRQGRVFDFDALRAASRCFQARAAAKDFETARALERAGLRYLAKAHGRSDWSFTGGSLNPTGDGGGRSQHAPRQLCG